jgi:hypothetical protein
MSEPVPVGIWLALVIAVLFCAWAAGPWIDALGEEPATEYEQTAERHLQAYLRRCE